MIQNYRFKRAPYLKYQQSFNNMTIKIATLTCDVFCPPLINTYF